MPLSPFLGPLQGDNGGETVTKGRAKCVGLGVGTDHALVQWNQNRLTAACVNLGKSFYFSGPQLLHLKNGMIKSA